MKEKDLQIKEMQDLLKQAQQKSSQGSQQRQGEARELVLEDVIAEKCPNDFVEPVAVGKGAPTSYTRLFVQINRWQV